MADTKITDLTPKVTGDAADEFVINDVTNGNLDKKIGMDGLRITESQVTDLGSYITAASADTLTNKTIDGDDNTIVDVNETQQNVSVGAAGTVLTSNGVGSAPSYQAGGAGDMVLASAQANTGIKTFDDTTMKLRNVAGTFDGYFTNTNTADRVYTLPDSAGTIALTSDLTGKFDTAGTGLTSSGTTVNAIGTANRISVSADAINIDTGYVGQASLTTLGTITTGVWTGTAITETNGGTNQTTYTTGDILYSSAPNTLSKLAKGTANQVLTMDGTGTNVAWANSAAGFTDPMTTRGDIIYKNAAGTTTRLAAGTVGQVIVSDGTDIAWGAAGAADNLGDHTATEIIKSVTFGLQGEEAGHTIIGTTASAAWTYTVPAGDTHDFVITGTGTIGQFAATGFDVTGNITVSGTVDGIDIATDVAANTAKVTNATHTGDVTGSGALTIGNDKVLTANILDANVTLAKLADISQNTVIGRIAVGNGVPIALTDVEVTAMLNVFSPTLQGLVPAATGGASTDYLSADGTFSVPPGGGSQTPWTSDINADTFALTWNDVDAAAPAGTVEYITNVAAGLVSNVATGLIHDYQVNNVSQLTISASTIDFQTNTLTDITDITSITSLNGVAIGSYALATGDTYTGAHLYTGATMRIPLSATPTMAVDGDFAIDTTVTDLSHGLLKFYDGEEIGVVSMPIAQYTTPTDGHVVSYNATNDEFELVAQSGAGGGSGTNETIVKSTDESRSTADTGDTLTIDDELVTASLATGEYTFECRLHMTASTGVPDIKWRFLGGATFTGGYVPGAWSGITPTTETSIATTSFHAVDATNSTVAIYGRFIVTGAGTFGLEWAQNTASAATTTLLAGSSLIVKSTGTGGGGGSTTLSGLTDTTITAAAKGDLLVHNGTAWIDVTVGTNDHVLTADSTAGSGVKWAAAAGGASTWTDVIPCVLEVPEGTDAYADVHALATQVSKVTGFVMPTDTDSTINFKVICPEDLAGTPAVVFRVYTLTLSANTTDAVNLTFNARYTGDTENTDQAFNQTVTATNYNVSDTIESTDYHDITPSTSPAAGDLITGQIFRDISADVAGDVLITGITMHIDRTTS